MEHCDHRTSRDSIFFHSRAVNATYDKRHYCKSCGLVKEDGGKPASYFINKLTDISLLIDARGKRYGHARITKVEKRLMILAIEADDVLSEPYGSTRECQIRHFTDIVQRHRAIPECVIKEMCS